MGKGALWLGVAIFVAAVLFFPFGSMTGNPILVDDTTPPVLTILSASVNANNVAIINLKSNDTESLITSISVYGPTEHTGYIRDTEVCNLNFCAITLNFSYNSVYDDKGNNYTVEAISAGGTTRKTVRLVFNGEGNTTNQTCTNECTTSGQFQCFGAYAKTCGNYDADSCLEWNAGTYCTYGCSGGSCLPNPGNQTNQTCADSDGGLNYNVKGNATQTYLNGTVLNYTDFCYGGISLQEYYCNGAVVNYALYTCQQGYSCVNGACIAGNQTTSCTETDGGVNYYVKGNNFGTLSPSGIVFNVSDFCNDGISLREYHCSGTSINLLSYTCSSGYSCSNGACVSNQTGNSTSCTDSDGGNNIYTKGNTYNSTFNGTDYCAGSGVLEYSCVGNNVIGLPLACPSGQCSNGACVQNPALTNVSYSIELISATDTSATIKATNIGAGTSQTREVTEGTSSVINGLGTYLIEADETSIHLFARTKYNLGLSIGGTLPSSTTLKFINSPYPNSNYIFELISATDTSATIKATNIGAGTSQTREVTEGTSSVINGVTVTVSSADETNSILLASIDVESFYLEILQPFCTDSDGGLAYNVKGNVSTNTGNFTDYCQGNSTVILNEYFCSGTSAQKTQYSCSYGCVDGLCKAKPRNPRCKSLFCAVKSLFGGNKYST